MLIALFIEIIGGVLTETGASDQVLQLQGMRIRLTEGVRDQAVKLG